MLRITLVLLWVVISSGCGAYALTSGRVAIRDDHATLNFSARDRAAIAAYYRAHPEKKTPPGLAKREKLPSGLAKRDTLPPGLQGRPLPRDLESRLTAVPAAYVRIVLGRDVLLMQRDTRLVLDILHGVAD